jgi:transcriptional regulator with XRE-family HTH domain
MPKRPYPRYQRRHDAIMLRILENPMQTQKEIAKATGYSPSQISRILCSPDFQAQYDVRMQESALLARSKWLTRAGSSS